MDTTSEIVTLNNITLAGVRIGDGTPRNVVVRDGRIHAIDEPGSAPQTPVWDASGLVMLPGLVDLHTHLREPGGEESETISTGTRAAAAGGFTDIFAMANTSPVTDSVQRWEAVVKASRGASARVHPVGAITMGLDGRELSPIRALAEAGATIFSDDGKCVDDAGLVRAAMRLAASTNSVIAQHAQHGQLAGNGQINEGHASATTGFQPWPGVAEETVIARDAILAAETGAHLHVCHVSTARSVEVIRWAKSQGWPVTAEVTPHHLLLTDELAALGDTRFKVNPPLRSAHDVMALRGALVDGTIDAVATDHAPHARRLKDRPWCEAAFGMTGMETALAVVAQVFESLGALSWDKVSDRMSTAPAAIGRISHLAGRPLRAGEQATFTLVNPSAPWTMTGDTYTKSANTPFLNSVFSKKVIATAIDGQLTHGAELFRNLTKGN
jgi:dihydroorotase